MPSTSSCGLSALKDRVFSFLDDVMVAVPIQHAEAAATIVLHELRKAGLQVNDKMDSRSQCSTACRFGQLSGS